MSFLKLNPQFQPREYQLFYLKKALENNVIICLGTGSGKTYITIMVLKEYAYQIKVDRKKAIFLAPTNPLVIQQSEAIKMHINLNVKAFYGSLGVDVWEEKKWLQEINQNDVFVMTPDIFNTIMTKQIILLDQICVLIFDECHWAGMKKKNKGGIEPTNHAYKKIMNYIIKNDYHNRIRIIGTTASVVNACFDTVCLPECFKELEITFNAKILGEFDFDPRFLAEPDILIWLFKENLEMTEEYSTLFNVISLLDKIIKSKKRLEEIDENESYRARLNLNLGYLRDRSSFKPDIIKKMIRDICDVQRELGVWSSFILCQKFREELKISIERAMIEKSDESCELIKLSDSFLLNLQNSYSRTIFRLKEINKDNAMMNLASCKLLRLLDIIFCYYEKNHDFSILIFVDRVSYCYAIAKFFEQLSTTQRFSYISPSFFVGNNNEYLNFKFIREAVKNSKETINQFKSGKINILFTTAVLEEGMDIGKCNLVIRFNEARTYREFAQSKGRARAKNSFFVLMHDNLQSLNNSINVYNRTEEFLIHKFKQSKSCDFQVSVLEDGHKIDDIEECIISRTGSELKIWEAGPWIVRYIAKKGRKFYEPQFAFEEVESLGFRCKLNLQGLTPLTEEVQGKFYLDKDESFKSACLAACKKLYEIGQLDDHFIAISDENVVKSCSLLSKEYTDDEKKEINFIFQNNEHRLTFYRKQISRFSYFKNFFTDSGYDLYELIFETEDPFLNQKGKSKLALLTKLQLTQACKITKLYSSLHEVDVKLALISRDVQLTDTQIQAINSFTLQVFHTAIPVLKKRKDLTIDFEKFLFQFVFIDNQNFIDYNNMKHIVDFKPEDEISMRGQILVKALHTNTNYELISTQTGVYPTDTFEWAEKIVSYNEYFKEKYDVTIENQNEQLYQLKCADLIGLYSIYVGKATNVKQNRESKFDIFLPKQLIVPTAFTKELFFKANCLPPLIYRIKQKIIIKNLFDTLNKKCLGVEIEPTNFDDIFTALDYESIDDSIHENYVKEVHGLPFLENSSEESGSSDTEKENQIELKEAEKRFKKTLDIVRKSFKRKSKEINTVEADSDRVHLPIAQTYLDVYLRDSLNLTLKEAGFNSLNEFLNEFTTRFEKIMNLNNRKTDLKCFEDVEHKLKRRKLEASEELININFNFWTNENSNKFLITPSCLLEALTTKSAVDGVNLERLEYIGDCFLKLATCCNLFHLYTYLSVGEMVILKNNAVSNKNLYGISKRSQMLNFIFADPFLPGANWLPSGFKYEGPTPNSNDVTITVLSHNQMRNMELKFLDKNKYQALRAKSISDSIESLIGGTLVSTGMRNTCILMKYLGIFSDEFHIDKNSEQHTWFEIYDPLENDQNDYFKKFTDFMYSKYDFQSLEYAIDYKFKNKSLLIQAFKHVSYDDPSKFPSYENLEFLGDAIIDYLIVKYFYDDPEIHFTPGEMTNLKQAMINNDLFGLISLKFDLYKYLIYNSPAIFFAINNFKEYFELHIRPICEEFPIIPNTYFVIDGQKSINLDGNIEIHKVLGDIFESLMAAIFIDSRLDFNAVWKVLHKFLTKELISFRSNPPKTFLSLLHEKYPKAKFSNFRMENREAKIEIEIDNKKFVGVGDNKKLAKMDAARKVLKKLQKS